MNQVLNTTLILSSYFNFIFFVFKFILKRMAFFLSSENLPKRKLINVYLIMILKRYAIILAPIEKKIKIDSLKTCSTKKLKLFFRIKKTKYVILIAYTYKTKNCLMFIALRQYE